MHQRGVFALAIVQVKKLSSEGWLQPNISVEQLHTPGPGGKEYRFRPIGLTETKNYETFYHDDEFRGTKGAYQNLLPQPLNETAVLKRFSGGLYVYMKLLP